MQTVTLSLEISLSCSYLLLVCCCNGKMYCTAWRLTILAGLTVSKSLLCSFWCMEHLLRSCMHGSVLVRLSEGKHVGYPGFLWFRGILLLRICAMTFLSAQDQANWGLKEVRSVMHCITFILLPDLHSKLLWIRVNRHYLLQGVLLAWVRDLRGQIRVEAWNCANFEGQQRSIFLCKICMPI